MYLQSHTHTQLLSPFLTWLGSCLAPVQQLFSALSMHKITHTDTHSAKTHMQLLSPLLTWLGSSLAPVQQLFVALSSHTHSLLSLLLGPLFNAVVRSFACLYHWSSFKRLPLLRACLGIHLLPAYTVSALICLHHSSCMCIHTSQASLFGSLRVMGSALLAMGGAVLSGESLLSILSFCRCRVKD